MEFSAQTTGACVTMLILIQESPSDAAGAWTTLSSQSAQECGLSATSWGDKDTQAWVGFCRTWSEHRIQEWGDPVPQNLEEAQAVLRSPSYVPVLHCEPLSISAIFPKLRRLFRKP